MSERPGVVILVLAVGYALGWLAGVWVAPPFGGPVWALAGLVLTGSALVALTGKRR